MIKLLADKYKFAEIEKELRENGRLRDFEKECGKITGRMMITLGEVPEDLEAKIEAGSRCFICTFDFYECSIGIILNTVTKKVGSGLWITPQKKEAEPPSKDWINFFIETLVNNIDKDGSFGVPIYVFVNDSADMTVVPSK